MVERIAATGLRIGELLAGGAVASTGLGDRHVGGSGVGVRVQVPATEDVAVSADDSAWASHDRVAERTSRSIDAQERRRSGVPEQVRRPSPRIEAAGARATTGGGTGGAWTRDVASVPPHSFVTLLNVLRVPVKIAQEQLGHASIQTTLNIHTHVVDASHRAAIDSLEQRLFPSVPKSPKADTPSESLSTKERAG
jgi:integrase